MVLFRRPDKRALLPPGRSANITYSFATRLVSKGAHLALSVLCKGHQAALIEGRYPPGISHPLFHHNGSRIKGIAVGTGYMLVKNRHGANNIIGINSLYTHFPKFKLIANTAGRNGTANIAGQPGKSDWDTHILSQFCIVGGQTQNRWMTQSHPGTGCTGIRNYPIGMEVQYLYREPVKTLGHLPASLVSLLTKTLKLQVVQIKIIVKVFTKQHCSAAPIQINGGSIKRCGRFNSRPCRFHLQAQLNRKVGHLQIVHHNGNHQTLRTMGAVIAQLQRVGRQQGGTNKNGVIALCQSAEWRSTKKTNMSRVWRISGSYSITILTCLLSLPADNTTT